MSKRAFLTALREIRVHPWRSLLAAQGMLWAVALVVLPACVIQGSKKAAIERAAELGTNRIEVAPDAGARSARGEVLLDEDLSALREGLPLATDVSGLRIKAARSPASREWLWLLGADEHLLAARGCEMLEGRFPVTSTGDVEVALEKGLAALLFGDGAVLGQRLELDLAARPQPTLRRVDTATDSPSHRTDGTSAVIIRAIIVGVVTDERSRRTDALGFTADQALSDSVSGLMDSFGFATDRPPWLHSGLGVYLPRQHVPGDRIFWLFLHCDPLLVDQVSEQAESLLVGRGRRVVVTSNAVWAILLKPELDGYMSLHDVLSGIYLGVGLLIMANLLLLAGLKRRREIALRRVEGASRADIFGQFVWEGLLLAILGVALGIPTGLGLGAVRCWVDPNIALAVTMPWAETGRSLLVILAGALLASVYPAWNASRHQPMDILRRGGSP